MAKWAAENPTIVQESFTRQDFVQIPGYSDANYSEVKKSADDFADKEGFMVFEYYKYTNNESLTNADSIFKDQVDKKIRQEYNYSGGYTLFTVPFRDGKPEEGSSVTILYSKNIVSNSSQQSETMANIYASILYNELKYNKESGKVSLVIQERNFIDNIMLFFQNQYDPLTDIGFEANIWKLPDYVKIKIHTKCSYKILNFSNIKNEEIKKLNFRNISDQMNAKFQDINYHYTDFEKAYWLNGSKKIKTIYNIQVLFEYYSDYKIAFEDDFSKITKEDKVVIIVNNDKYGHWGGFSEHQARFITIAKGNFENSLVQTLMHEEGHNLGLPHLEHLVDGIQTAETDCKKNKNCTKMENGKITNNLMCYCYGYDLLKSQYKKIKTALRFTIYSELDKKNDYNGYLNHQLNYENSNMKQRIINYLEGMKKIKGYEGLDYNIPQ